MYNFQPIPLEQARDMVSKRRETEIVQYKEMLDTRVKEALAKAPFPRITFIVPYALGFLSGEERETILYSFAESYQTAGYKVEIIRVGSPSHEFSVKISFEMA